MRQTLVSFVALLTVATCTTFSRGEEGGNVDPLTGVVWSQSQRAETGSWWRWNSAATRAADYWVMDVDQFGVLTQYSDWRVPTVRELQAAIADGTIGALIPRNSNGSPMYAGTVYLWSSESRGSKGWAVSVTINSSGQVTGGGTAKLFVKDSASTCFFVRP